MARNLPDIHEWEEYMDVATVSACPNVPISEFLMKNEFGKQLSEGRRANLLRSVCGVGSLSTA